MGVGQVAQLGTHERPLMTTPTNPSFDIAHLGHVDLPQTDLTCPFNVQNIVGGHLLMVKPRYGQAISIDIDHIKMARHKLFSNEN